MSERQRGLQDLTIEPLGPYSDITRGVRRGDRRPPRSQIDVRRRPVTPIKEVRSVAPSASLRAFAGSPCDGDVVTDMVGYGRCRRETRLRGRRSGPPSPPGWASPEPRWLALVRIQSPARTRASRPTGYPSLALERAGLSRPRREHAGVGPRCGPAACVTPADISAARSCPWRESGNGIRRAAVTADPVLRLR